MPSGDTNGAPRQAVALPKVATHVDGLDVVLHGGLPAGRTTLLSGGPGCGKSLLALEFLYRGALAGEPGILVLFEEGATAVRRNALTLGWDLVSLEHAGTLWLLEGSLDPAVVLAGDFDLQGLLAVLGGQAARLGARRVVLDGVDVLTRILADPQRERSELYGLHRWLLDRGLTAILTMKETPEHGPLPSYAFLDFMADCVIKLDQRFAAQINTRRLQVLKYRGSGFGRNEYPYVIMDDGVHRAGGIYLDGTRAGTGFTMEARLRRASDGAYRWHLNRSVPLRDAAGNVVKFIGTCTDVHEQKQAAETRERLAAIVDSSDDAIIGQTLEGVITSWNRSAERLYGYTAAEALGQPIGLLVPRDVPDEIPQILARLQQGERVDHYETQRVRKDGTRLDVSLTLSPIRDSTGRVIGASKIARDITARKRADAALQQAHATLEQRVEERTALLALIQDVTRAANEASRSTVALQYALDRFCAYTGWPVGHVYLAVAPGADRWAPTALWHLDAPERCTAFQQATQGLEFAAGEGLIGRVGARGSTCPSGRWWRSTHWWRRRWISWPIPSGSIMWPCTCTSTSRCRSSGAIRTNCNRCCLTS